MKPERIEQLAKQAGLVQGPWANGKKERIWQENREFPDALEVYTQLVIEECAKFLEDVMDDHFAAEEMLDHFENKS